MENVIIDGFIRKDNMVYVSESEYENTHDDFKGVWGVERWDIPEWGELRDQYMGKRTIMPPFSLFGCTCLMIEGVGMQIVSDEEWKKIAEQMQ